MLAATPCSPAVPSQPDKLERQLTKVLVDRIKSATATAVHHALKHTGVGLVCAVAYFDP